MTLYNRAHLLSRLRNLGFELEFNARHELQRGVRRSGTVVEEIVNFDYFHRLIYGSLMTLDSVTEMIAEALRAGHEKRTGGRTKIGIQPIISRKSDRKPLLGNER